MKKFEVVISGEHEKRDNELQIPEFLRTHQGSIRERGKMARRG